MKRFHKKSILALTLAAALALAALLAGCQSAAPASQNGAQKSAGVLSYNTDVQNGTDEQNPASTGISVSGQGSVYVKPDMATVQFGVQTLDADAGKARTANDDAMGKVIAAVKALGVSADEITTTNYSINPQYDSDNVNITGYAVNDTVSVKVLDLTKLGDVISAAVSAGANSSYGVNFDVQDRSDAYNQALAQAMDKAKARAALMAQACGVTLGRVMTINESSYSPGPMVAMDESFAGAKAASTPVSSGQLEIQASVSVVYEIVK